MTLRIQWLINPVIYRKPGCSLTHQPLGHVVEHVEGLQPEQHVLPVRVHDHTWLVVAPGQEVVVTPVKHCVRRLGAGCTRGHRLVQFVAIVSWMKIQIIYWHEFSREILYSSAGCWRHTASRTSPACCRSFLCKNKNIHWLEQFATVLKKLARFVTDSTRLLL